jgi:hypothetical protein
MKRNRKKHRGNTIKRIGLMSGKPMSDAIEFFESIKERKFPKSKSFYSQCNEICTACLREFIESNRISLLFIDIDDVTFEGENIQDVSDIIAHIGHECNCHDIYLVTKNR